MYFCFLAYKEFFLLSILSCNCNTKITEKWLSSLFTYHSISTEFWSIGVIYVRNLRARCSQ